jgi:hypothetical protein
MTLMRLANSAGGLPTRIDRHSRKVRLPCCRALPHGARVRWHTVAYLPGALSEVLTGVHSRGLCDPPAWLGG